MSNRTLIEINHDYEGRMGDGFIEALGRYLRSASRESAEALERYGARVIGMRHHSGKFILDGTPDGFPPQYLTRAAQPAGELCPKCGGTHRERYEGACDGPPRAAPPPWGMQG